MGWHLYIAGVDRVEDYRGDEPTIRINPELTYLIDTASFRVKGARPINGSAVVVEDDDPAVGRLFAGRVKKTKLFSEMPDLSFRIWQVECTDLTDSIDRKQVTEEYTNETADAIFLDIVTKYCPGFTTAGVMSGAPTIEFIQFDHEQPSACFKRLCEYVGWEWQPDYFNDLRFYNAQVAGSQAPMQVDGFASFSDFDVAIDETGLVNCVDVLGGVMLSDPKNLEFKYDGKMRAWTIPYKAHELRIFVSEVEKSVGIENVDDPATKDFLFNYQENRISMGSNYSNPLEGATIRQNMRYEIQAITRVEDLASQAAVAAVQGGDGVYMYSIKDDKLVTLQAIEAAGNAYLALNANPKINGSFLCAVPGWVPGQLVTINQPDRGVTGVYTVQSMEITRVSQQWKFRVLFGGRLLGVADVLTALVNNQRASAIGNAAVLQKYLNVNEVVIITDELHTITKAGGWICGAADAICGEVICRA